MPHNSEPRVQGRGLVVGRLTGPGPSTAALVLRAWENSPLGGFSFSTKDYAWGVRIQSSALLTPFNSILTLTDHPNHNLRRSQFSKGTIHLTPLLQMTWAVRFQNAKKLIPEELVKIQNPGPHSPEILAQEQWNQESA